MLSDLHNFELVWGIFGILIGGLAIIRRFWTCDAETLRKTLHVGMGLVALSLPWLFVSNWSVMLLTGSILALLMGIRLVRPLRKMLGGVIYDVERDSWGEIYFGLGVAGLFALSHGEPLLYGISILTLVLADTAASLIGCRHGFLRYRVMGECKSVEGSLAFLLTALLIGVLGLDLFGSLGIIDSLMVALAFTFPVTLVEAVAGKGTDNFFVPLCAFGLLTSLLSLNQLELIASLTASIVVVPVIFLLLYWRSHLDRAAIQESSQGENESSRRLYHSHDLPANGFFRMRSGGPEGWGLTKTGWAKPS